jgi:hypothetical protein
MDVPFIHGVSSLWCAMLVQAEQLSKNLNSRIKLMPYWRLVFSRFVPYSLLPSAPLFRRRDFIRPPTTMKLLL